MTRHNIHTQSSRAALSQGARSALSGIKAALSQGARQALLGINIALWLSITLVFASCSTTSGVPEGDKLFTGLTKIEYQNHTDDSHFLSTQEEVEAALATAPNGALFGSSYYRTPFPYALWIWNAFHASNNKAGRWITKTFGKAPVLMSQVNPELRASVAKSVLNNHGYFHSAVNYEIVPQKHIKKAKIGYQVALNDLFTVDTLQYENFPEAADSLIRCSRTKNTLHSGMPFDVGLLAKERKRVTALLRNNGYYYYQEDFASYLADTLKTPTKAQLSLQMAENVPPKATRKWYIGNIDVVYQRKYGDVADNSQKHRSMTTHFQGKRPPVRARIVRKALKLRRTDEYSAEKHAASIANLNTSSIFSLVQTDFTPRDTTDDCDTLDMRLTCFLAKPYDTYIETDFNTRTSGSTGPELRLGLTKRNAFRGGETFDVNLHASYEWQSKNNVTSNGKGGVNSYEYGLDASIDFPRLIVPFLKRQRLLGIPSTKMKLEMNVLNRTNYFKMHTFQGEWTYRWQKRENQLHEFSPLLLNYQHLNYTTEKFKAIMEENPYLKVTMQDVLSPKMRYTFRHTSPKNYRNPINWQASITEAGNLIALCSLASGKHWGEEGKEMFKNAYAQFLKIEASMNKTWAVGEKSSVVAHLEGGIVCTYGNSRMAPYSEQFYVGGANSIRAFTVRSLGPGKYTAKQANMSYLDQTGDIKLQANLEYRFHLLGSLYGATFLDAGNVWALRNDAYREGAQFKAKNVLKQTALGTGLGLRYDLDFLVLRLDWGLGLHVPYDTGKKGFYNIPKFSEGHSLHLAVGYPF